MNQQSRCACRHSCAETVARILEIARKSEERYGRYASLHEALGVIEEELLELKIAIHDSDWDRARAEFCDIAAVCVRIASHETSRERNGEI